MFYEAEGNPKPLVIWRKSGSLLQSSISKTELIIQEVSDNEAGIYICEVSNSAGTVTYTVEVTIKSKLTHCTDIKENLGDGLWTKKKKRNEASYLSDNKFWILSFFFFYFQNRISHNTAFKFLFAEN